MKKKLQKRYYTRLILIVIVKAATLRSKKFLILWLGTMQITSAICRTARPRQIRRRARHTKITKSVASYSIEYIRGEATKKVNRFFRPLFIRSERIDLV